MSTDPRAGTLPEESDLIDVDASLSRIGAYRSTVYAAVPSIYQYWLDRPNVEHFDLSSVRLLAFGGSAMAAPVIQRESGPIKNRANAATSSGSPTSSIGVLSR